MIAEAIQEFKNSIHQAKSALLAIGGLMGLIVLFTLPAFGFDALLRVYRPQIASCSQFSNEAAALEVFAGMFCILFLFISFGEYFRAGRLGLKPFVLGAAFGLLAAGVAIASC